MYRQKDVKYSWDQNKVSFPSHTEYSHNNYPFIENNYHHENQDYEYEEEEMHDAHYEKNSNFSNESTYHFRYDEDDYNDEHDTPLKETENYRETNDIWEIEPQPFDSYRYPYAKTDNAVHHRRRGYYDEDIRPSTESEIDYGSFTPWMRENNEEDNRFSRLRRADPSQVCRTRAQNHTRNNEIFDLGHRFESRGLSPLPAFSAVRLRAGGPLSDSSDQSQLASFSRTAGESSATGSQRNSQSVQIADDQRAQNEQGTSKVTCVCPKKQSPSESSKERQETAEESVQQSTQDEGSPPSARKQLGWSAPNLEEELYAEVVRRELELLMGPDEAPSGVPAPAAPKVPCSKPKATRQSPGVCGVEAEADGAAGEAAGSWPRAALSTRWLSDHLCALRCTEPCLAEFFPFL